jgi:hypothetical protein
VGEVRDYGTGTRLLGLSFDWWIDPLQPVIDMADGTSLTRVQRLSKTSLYLRGAYAAQVGARVLTLTAGGMELATVPAPRDNWWSVRHLGWARENDERLTPRITRDTPLPCGVLAMVREVIV